VFKKHWEFCIARSFFVNFIYLYKFLAIFKLHVILFNFIIIIKPYYKPNIKKTSI